MTRHVSRDDRKTLVIYEILCNYIRCSNYVTEFYSNEGKIETDRQDDTRNAHSNMGAYFNNYILL